MNANSPIAPRMLKAAEKRILALDYRTKGYNLQEIADKIDGLNTPQGVHKTLKVAFENLLTKQLESADHLRALELQRLDNLWYSAYKQAVKDNNLQAIDRCIKIMKRRAELLGIDAPVKSEANINTKGKIIVTFAEPDDSES